MDSDFPRDENLVFEALGVLNYKQFRKLLKGRKEVGALKAWGQPFRMTLNVPFMAGHIQRKHYLVTNEENTKENLHMELTSYSTWGRIIRHLMQMVGLE